MFTFATDYCIAAFLSTTGALQFAFSVGGVHGLLAFKRAIVARTLGIALAVSGFVFFFGVGERNINDYEGGLDAPAQALFFSYGALGALIFTLALTSLTNWRMRGPESGPESGNNSGAGTDDGPDVGIDALRHTNYALALWRSAGYWWNRWKR